LPVVNPGNVRTSFFRCQRQRGVGAGGNLSTGMNAGLHVRQRLSACNSVELKLMKSQGTDYKYAPARGERNFG